MGIEPTYQFLAGTLDLKSKSTAIRHPSQKAILRAKSRTLATLRNFNKSAHVSTCQVMREGCRHKIDINKERDMRGKERRQS